MSQHLHASGHSDGVNTRELVSLAWSFAIAGVPSSSLYSVMSDEITKRMSAFNSVQLSQLHQVSLFLEYEAFWLPPLTKCENARSTFQAAAMKMAQSSTRSSGQAEVSRLLADELNWSHESEFITSEILSLDMANSNERLAVEFDGPSHFASAPRTSHVDPSCATRVCR